MPNSFKDTTRWNLEGLEIEARSSEQATSTGEDLHVSKNLINGASLRVLQLSVLLDATDGLNTVVGRSVSSSEGSVAEFTGLDKASSWCCLCPLRVGRATVRPRLRPPGRLRSSLSGRVGSLSKLPGDRISEMWLALYHGGVTKRCAGPKSRLMSLGVR